MKEEQPTVMDLVVEVHAGLERQGPGSPEMTLKAFSFLDDVDNMTQVADLGCGSGGQTMVLARHMAGSIVGVDMFPNFIDVLNRNAQKQGLAGRVKGIVGSMESLPFPEESLDLIWSEGAIDNIGFEKGLTYWNRFLKGNGYVAVTCPAWLTDERPAEVEKFWTDAGSGLEAVERNVAAMQTAGYGLIAAFALPAQCWTAHYFAPREAALQILADKYAGNKTVEDFVADNRYEVQLYEKYGQYYGYVFYIGKKMKSR